VLRSFESFATFETRLARGSHSQAISEVADKPFLKSPCALLRFVGSDNRWGRWRDARFSPEAEVSSMRSPEAASVVIRLDTGSLFGWMGSIAARKSGAGDHVNLERWLYAGGRPNRLARMLNGGWAAVYSAGLWPRRLNTLELKGRRTGSRVALPVVVADFEGERYLVSMLGEGAS
jgi:hypothetical protein